MATFLYYLYTVISKFKVFPFFRVVKAELQEWDKLIKCAYESLKIHGELKQLISTRNYVLVSKPL